MRIKPATAAAGGVTVQIYKYSGSHGKTITCPVLPRPLTTGSFYFISFNDFLCRVQTLTTST